MVKTHKTKRKIIIVLCLIAIINVFGCKNINQEYAENIKEEYIADYVLNTNSMKVHAARCVSAHKISDKNRKEVSDKLSNIIKSGYSICKNCKAGLKKEDAIQNLKDKFLYSNLLLDEPKDLPTIEEYLNAIAVIGNWYVNNVPTYMTELEEEKTEDYIGNDKYIERYQLRNRYKNKSETNKIYNVITDNMNARTIELYAGENILKANKNAVSSYGENYKKIKFTKTLAYYDCDLIKNSEDDYKKAGDDCVRFMFSIMNSIDSSWTRLLGEYSKSKWSKIDSKTLCTDDKDVLYAMSILGFRVYDKSEIIVDINKDKMIDVDVTKIDSGFNLQYGDIITRKGHIHFYLGCDSIVECDNFGWGKVNRVFPQSSRIEIEKVDDNYLVKYTNLITGKVEYYTRVYRYVGKER